MNNEKEKPFFSIITCTYNSEKFIRDNLNSAKQQTYKNFEHIFVDGFSNDSTYEILLKHALNNRNVKIIQSPAQGISNAMNIGINNSAGEYVFFLNSDDYFYNELVLEKIYNFLILNKNFDWIYGKINVIKKNSKIGIFPAKKIWMANDKNKIKRYLLKIYNFIPHQAVFMKKETARQNRFNENLSSYMDIDLWLKIRKKTSWTFVSVIVSNYRIHENSQSSSNKKQQHNNQILNLIRHQYLNKIELLISIIIRKIFTKKHNYQ